MKITLRRSLELTWARTQEHTLAHVGYQAAFGLQVAPHLDYLAIRYWSWGLNLFTSSVSQITTQQTKNCSVTFKMNIKILSV